MPNRTALVLSLLLPFSLLVSACGEDGSTGSARVVDVYAVDNTLRVGDGTVIGVDLAYDPEHVFDGDGNVVVAVRLTPELRYRTDTSEIDGAVRDDRVGAQIRQCVNGDTYLIYEMDRYDLESASDPSREANARLTFTVEAAAPVTVTTVEAAADNQTPWFSCDSGLLADELVGISIR